VEGHIKTFSASVMCPSSFKLLPAPLVMVMHSPIQRTIFFISNFVLPHLCSKRSYALLLTKSQHTPNLDILVFIKFIVSDVSVPFHCFIAVKADSLFPLTPFWIDECLEIWDILFSWYTVPLFLHWRISMLSVLLFSWFMTHNSCDLLNIMLLVLWETCSFCLCFIIVGKI